MKKKLSPSYTYPVLKFGYRTFIEFWARDSDGCYRRFRPTFNLNRIHNLPDRRERGADLCAKIKWWLVNGHCIDEFDEGRVVMELKEKEQTPAPENHKAMVSVRAALDVSLKIKHSAKRSTNRSFASHARRFVAFLQEHGYGAYSIGELTRPMAHEYLDYYKLKRNVRNNTLNNVITHMRALFTPLVDRGYMETNLFSKLGTYRAEEKLRRNFSTREATTVLQYVFEHDKVLFFSIILEYACLIRPSELLRLRFYDIDLVNYLVVLERGKTKMDLKRIATIPEDLQIYFKDDFWTKYPEDYLIFGKLLQPHRTKPAGDGSLYRRHQKVLHNLKALNLLEDITGLQYYSWKDTGVTDIIESMGLMAAYDQAGHRDIKQTMRYRHRQVINHKVRKMKFNKLDKL